MNDDKKKLETPPRKRAPRRPRTIKRDCPECFLEHGHEPWCKKSE